MFKIFFYINKLSNIQKDNLNKLKNINIIYRNYSKQDYVERAFILKKFCKKRNFKLFISNDYPLSIKIHADGVYIPSFNKSFRINNNKKLKLIGSAHTINQITEKKNQGCKIIFLSPFFLTDSHPKKLNLGLNKFNFLKENFITKIRFIPLGGINKNNFQKLFIHRLDGFAAISMMEKKLENNTISKLNLIASIN